MNFGGQLLRTPEHARPRSSRLEPDRMKQAGYGLMQSLRKTSDIDWLFDAQVLGVFKDNQLLVHAGRSGNPCSTPSQSLIEIQAETLIVATGARERYLPFKGWTLPGVISLGAAQILMKSHGLLPARSTLIAGSSPLMMVFASELMSHKGRVAGFVDENTWASKLAFLPLVKHHWPKLLEGAFYGAQMFLRDIPVFQGYRVIEARGKQGFESAVIARTTPEGHVVPGTVKIMKANALSIGYGFVPNIELPLQAGCDMVFERDQGGWIVKANHLGETSDKSIFAVGELTGIAGSKKSFLQGEVAAMAILKRQGKAGLGKDKLPYDRQLKYLLCQIQQQKEYAAFLNRLCRVPDNAYAAIPDDTVICRCEDITMGIIKNRIQQGFGTIGSLKKATRCGMGRCQGRICGPVIFDIISSLTGAESQDIGAALSRAPVKNVELKSFLH